MRRGVCVLELHAHALVGKNLRERIQILEKKRFFDTPSFVGFVNTLLQVQKGRVQVVGARKDGPIRDGPEDGIRGCEQHTGLARPAWSDTAQLERLGLKDFMFCLEPSVFGLAPPYGHTLIHSLLFLGKA